MKITTATGTAILTIIFFAIDYVDQKYFLAAFIAIYIVTGDERMLYGLLLDSNVTQNMPNIWQASEDKRIEYDLCTRIVVLK